MIVSLVGVPFDGMGRNPGQAGAPAALRAAGFEAALSRRDIRIRRDLVVPGPRADRDPKSGLLNGAALLTMIEALGPELTGAMATGQFPLVYGADCSVLLAALPALGNTVGEPGLLFIDGHEDATLMEQSPDGEAANMEIAILLGMTGHGLPQPLNTAVGALKPEALVMLGPHDDPFRRPLRVGTVADRVSLLHSDDVFAAPARAAMDAVQHIRSHASNWWLHTDLDVLDSREFSACGAPGEVALSGGLTWRALTAVVVAALDAGGCRGWSLVIYNPDLDPDGSQARRIVQFVNEVAVHLP